MVSEQNGLVESALLDGSWRRNAVVHGVMWFVAVASAIYVTTQSLWSAMAIGGVGAICYAALVHVWEPY